LLLLLLLLLLVWIRSLPVAPVSGLWGAIHVLGIRWVFAIKLFHLLLDLTEDRVERFLPSICKLVELILIPSPAAPLALVLALRASASPSRTASRATNEVLELLL